MIIDCVADLHGEYPDMKGGDVLIVAGDLTGSDKPIQYGQFGCWIQRQSYKKKILIGGNHDNYLEKKGPEFIQDIYQHIGVDYLCDSGLEFEFEETVTEDHKFKGTISYPEKKKFKVWGTPWTAQFPGINPHCCAFTVNYGCDTDYWLDEYWQQIPSDIDILITHCPPHGILDKVRRGDEHTGSKTLREHVLGRIKPRIHVFGHIHEWGGKLVDCCTTRFINCSHMNEEYDPVNKPVRIIL